MSAVQHRFLLLVAAVATLVFALAPLAAYAHLGNISYSDVQVSGTIVGYRLKFAAHLMPGLSADGGRATRRDVVAREAHILAWLTATVRVEAGGRTCVPKLSDLIGPDFNDDLMVVLAYTCVAPPPPLRIDFHPFDSTMPQYQNIVSVHMGDDRTSYVFSAGTSVLKVGAAPAATGATFQEFLELGIEHILTGYDHLLFLLALLLLGGTIWRLAGIVTAFTIAHSVTLALSTLGIFSLPPRPVEIAIAGSIVYVAAENLISTRADHRWAVTFAFGLVHGFGFAGVLREVGLPAGAVFLPLLAFNAGVEIGQIVVVSVMVPLLRVSARGLGERPVRLAVSTAIIGAGLFWIVERSFGVL